MKIEIGNSYCKVLEATTYQIETLSKKLSYEDSGMKYLKIKNPKLYRFDTRKKLFNKKTSKFPTGLLTFVQQIFADDHIELVDTRKAPTKTLYLTKQLSLPELRYYQREAIAATVEPRGTLEMATGVGKTVLALEIIYQKGVNTLYVTPSLGIKEQTLKIFEGAFGKRNVGTHKDTKAKPITICNYQGIQNKDQEWFNNFDMLLVDEAQHSKADSIFDLNKKFWNHIYYRYFLSATPYTNNGSDMLLNGVIGETIYTYTPIQAIKDGYLVAPYFFLYKIQHSGKQYNSYQEEYDSCIVNNTERNNFITDIVKEIRTKDQSQILIMVDRVEHGSKLHSLIPDSNYANGSTKDNTKTIEKFNRGEIKTLIATSILGEGIDIPRAKILILAGTGKAESQIFQKVGRVLRPHSTKNKAIIIDFDDQGTHWLCKHTLERMKYYKTYISESIGNFVKVIE
jgi:superfamily II DNA or RNA helicase